MPEAPPTRRRLLRPSLSMELIEEASKLFKVTSASMKLSPTNKIDKATDTTPRLMSNHHSLMEPMMIGGGDSSGKHQTSPFLLIARSPGLRFVFLTSILQNAGLSVVVPSLALRLESMSASPRLLGIIAAAAPLVSVISPTLTGFLADRMPKRITHRPYTWVYLISMICFIAGNILQTFARGPMVLGIARAIIGISTGSSAIGISHVSRELRDPSERMSVVSVYSGVEMMGYILGTATGGLLSSVDANLFGLFHIDGFTAPTLFPAIAGLLLTIAGLPGFARSELLVSKERQKERSELRIIRKQNHQKNSFRDLEEPVSPNPTTSPFHIGKGSVNKESGGNSSGGSGNGTVGSSDYDHDVKLFLSPHARTCIQGIIIILYCLASAMYNAFETTSTPITGLHFGWGVRENAFLWTISGFIGCVTSVCIAHIPHSTIMPSDFLIVGLIFAIVGPMFMLLSFSHDSINVNTGALKIKDVNSSISEMRIPLFWIGFLFCDIANIIFESVFTLLFSTLVESNVDAGHDDESSDNFDIDYIENEDEDEENNNEAFLFGLFNSIGWFLGCALGAIVGNMLFLISTSALLYACTSCAAFILVVTVFVRKSLFSPHETGVLLRKISNCLGGSNSKASPFSSTLKGGGGDDDGEAEAWEGHSDHQKISLNRRQNSSLAPP